MKKMPFSFFGLILFAAAASMNCYADDVKSVALNEYNYKGIVLQEYGTLQINKSVDGHPLTVAGTTYEKGLGTHADSVMIFALDGDVIRFKALVGIDDDGEKTRKGTVVFKVVGDSKVLWESGVIKSYEPAKECDVDVSGVKLLMLMCEGANDGITDDHGDWLNATFTYKGKKPELTTFKVNEAPYILTPPAPKTPRINGAKIFGVRPGHPFLYRIPCTGQRPITFAAEGLPEGLTLDAKTGIITGTIAAAGTTTVTLQAENKLGKVDRLFTIVCGDKIALTPPMGWNSWNCFANNVRETDIRNAAKALIESGLADYGYNYVNLDDYWTNKPTSDDPDLLGPERDLEGNIILNKRFKNMKSLYDYIHSLGLKGGIYSSPGPYTCGGCIASFDHEFLDVKKLDEWGVDYLKYDWCSYNPEMETSRSRTVNWDKTSLPGLEKKYPELRSHIVPYALMDYALKTANRDIVYSLCQYGKGDVQLWGEEVGGNCWRTTGDIRDTWRSVRGIWKKQVKLAPYAGPGHWNDPDMLAVGALGWGEIRPNRMTPSEQYTHYSAWALLNSPMLLGNDLTKLDDFTRNILTNNEVIDVNQDTLGKQATRIMNDDTFEVWSKPLEDGSIALGVFHISESFSTDPTDFQMPWNKLGFDKAPSHMRDLWKQQDVKVDGDKLACEKMPYHSVKLFRIRK
ncbi:alpha-galactosidase [Candidatus Sumerlaeota bacterium]|nr:NPCBM/NEW2 domain-containing protein [Candidatus Sumerlaeales bacterium]NLD61100.1 alpha-galactosidase [Candidatus Sumerlaeota bacterium]